MTALVAVVQCSLGKYVICHISEFLFFILCFKLVMMTLVIVLFIKPELH